MQAMTAKWNNSTKRQQQTFYAVASTQKQAMLSKEGREKMARAIDGRL